jgi:hypothetical protein
MIVRAAILGGEVIWRDLTMRLRLSDAATFSFLAGHHRAQAEMCRQMAVVTASPLKESWLEFAEEWTKLAQEAETKAALQRRIDAPA